MKTNETNTLLHPAGRNSGSGRAAARRRRRAKIRSKARLARGGRVAAMERYRLLGATRGPGVRIVNPTAHDISNAIGVGIGYVIDALVSRYVRERLERGDIVEFDGRDVRIIAHDADGNERVVGTIEYRNDDD